MKENDSGGTNDLVRQKRWRDLLYGWFGGLRGRDKDPGKELDFAGIFMWKDGKVTLAIKDIATPNGLAFSPDEKSSLCERQPEQIPQALRRATRRYAHEQPKCLSI